MARAPFATLLAIALAATAAAAPALAPAFAQMPAIEENRREARLLADVLEIPREAEAMVARARLEMIDATMKSSDLAEEAAARIVDDIMMPNFRARLPELIAQLVEPIAVNFTYTDLRELRAFYASPLGRKLLRTLPVAQAQGAEAGLAWSRQVFQDSVDRHADELRARGLKF